MLTPSRCGGADAGPARVPARGVRRRSRRPGSSAAARDSARRAAALLGHGPRGRGRRRAARRPSSASIPGIEVRIEKLPWTRGARKAADRLRRRRDARHRAARQHLARRARGGRRARAAAAVARCSAGIVRGRSLRRHLAHQPHRRQAVRRAVVRRHAAAVLPHATCFERGRHRRRCRDDWAELARALDALQRAGVPHPLLLPLNEFEPLLALGAAAARTAAARRRPLRQLLAAPAFSARCAFYLEMLRARPCAVPDQQRRSPTCGRSSAAARSRPTSRGRGTSASSSAACRAELQRTLDHRAAAGPGRAPAPRPPAARAS